MAVRNGGIQQAMALLIQNQVAFVLSQQAFFSQMTQAFERMRNMERRLDTIEAILLRHEQMLIELPEAIRQKIGFKAR
jgi:hypothetical protein